MSFSENLKGSQSQKLKYCMRLLSRPVLVHQMKNKTPVQKPCFSCCATPENCSFRFPPACSHSTSKTQLFHRIFPLLLFWMLCFALWGDTFASDPGWINCFLLEGICYIFAPRRGWRWLKEEPILWPAAGEQCSSLTGRVRTHKGLFVQHHPSALPPLIPALALSGSVSKDTAAKKVEGSEPED